MQIKLVVFDLAGTTLKDDNNVADAFQKAFLANGISIEREDATPLMGYKKTTAIEMLLQQKGQSYEADTVDAIHDSFVSEMLDFYGYDASVKPMAGAEELFIFLKEKGIKLALNTGFPRVIAAAIIARFQWLEKGLVDEFIGSDEVPQGRPHPYMIYELKERLQIGLHDGVMKVGDTAVDMFEGKNAGCQYVVGITTGAASRTELEETNPTHIVDGLNQIADIVDEALSVYA